MLYENLVIESYAQQTAAGMPLVAIYPREGTFWSDHPYSILDAEWVGADGARGGRGLPGVPPRPPGAGARAGAGLPPGRPGDPDGAPVDAAHGVDPKQPQTLLEVPDAATLAKLLDAVAREQEPTDVVLVFDKSGSMQGQPLAEAKGGAKAFLEGLQPRDEVTLLFFDSQVYPPFGPVKVGEKKAELLVAHRRHHRRGRHRALRRDRRRLRRGRGPGGAGPRGGSTPWW